jgi:hypothetical protein
VLGWPPLDRVIDVPGLPGLTDLVKGNMAWVFSSETLNIPL